MAFFDKSSPGELSTTLTNNIDTIKSGINFRLGDFLNQFTRGLSCVILALALAWKFSVVFLALVPVMVLSAMRMTDLVRRYSTDENKSYANAGRIAHEMLSSLRTVLAFGLETRSLQLYADNLESVERMSKKKGLYGGIFSSISTASFNFMFGVGVYYAIYLYRHECEAYNAGNLIPSFFCLVTAGFAFGQALPYLTQLGHSRAAAERVYEIIDTRSAIDVFDTRVVKKKLDSLQGRIDFDQVEFSYPQRSDLNVLKGLNLSIPGGKTVALVGSR